VARAPGRACAGPGGGAGPTAALVAVAVLRGRNAGHRPMALRRHRRTAQIAHDFLCEPIRRAFLSDKELYMKHAVCTVARQRGFSLVEVSIVTAIVLLLAIIGIPAIGSYVVENKVPKVGESLARFILQTKVNAPNSSAQPYVDIETSHLANLVRDSSIFSVRGAAATPTILH